MRYYVQVKQADDAPEEEFFGVHFLASTDTDAASQGREIAGGYPFFLRRGGCCGPIVADSEGPVGSGAPCWGYESMIFLSPLWER